MKRWFHPAFETELVEAAGYLERQRPDFGQRFLDEVEAAIERIMQAPEAWRPWHGDIRRFLLARFRYTIRYRIRRDEDLGEFPSVIHTARHPDTGLDR
ncbi:MAG: type II toxin-antitoxin system RelE/ParE family toxin [Opitutaceae bacterium]